MQQQQVHGRQVLTLLAVRRWMHGLPLLVEEVLKALGSSSSSICCRCGIAKSRLLLVLQATAAMRLTQQQQQQGASPWMVALHRCSLGCEQRVCMAALLPGSRRVTLTALVRRLRHHLQATVALQTITLLFGKL
jgi:hypothetical protein